eukprot:TRINITY_DN12019_c0_g1_i1.p1 TRINITY_DN12019_c0_g1~~TRINITY_DN12019_c0_g1_i1.p1  ORF type:complete len:217 (-),score=24.96 TRINITY_DN12019_c0_g1_i1:161-811(-)
MQSTITVGVLALQGAFAEHVAACKAAAQKLGLQISVIEVRLPEQLKQIHGLIIPGGESTTMGIFLRQNDFLSSLREFVHANPTMGTCAGLILFANHVDGQARDGQTIVGGLDVDVKRNFFGRQLQSFESSVQITEKVGEGSSAPAVFIRAPGITSVGSNARVLAKISNWPNKDNAASEMAVAVEQGTMIGLTFHPELTDDTRWHEYFLNKLAQRSS